MKANVIRNHNIKKHNVEPYHFKVLGSNVNSHNEDFEEALNEFTEDIAPREKIKSIKSVQDNEIVEEEHEIKEAIPGDNFVEKLLKKTDELSSNIIKLQMQIENQEVEFEKRLNEEVQREKESALKEGYDKAKEENQEQINTMQNQYLRSVNVLNEECKKLQTFIKKTEEELTNVAIDIAKEVIQKELEENSSKVALSLSKTLMKEFEDKVNIQIKVNTQDYEALKDEFLNNENITVSTDDAITKGGVIILSNNGNLDGNISTRLEKIIQIMDE